MLKTIAVLLSAAVIGLCGPVLSPPSPSCASLGVGPANDILIPFAVWSAANFNCEQSGNIFSNFVPGAIPGDTILEIQQQTISPVDFHVVTFDGNFMAAFGVSYDIAVDLAASPNRRIVRAAGDLSNPSEVGNPSMAEAVFSESAVMIGSLTSLSASLGAPIVTNATALHVVDAYLPGGGAAVSVANAFAEEETPELATMLIAGSGLVLLAYHWKRRKA